MHTLREIMKRDRLGNSSSKPSMKLNVNEKIDFQRKFAIKNSAGGVPEGKPTILRAPMCNGDVVSQFRYS